MTLKIIIIYLSYIYMTMPNFRRLKIIGKFRRRAWDGIFVPKIRLEGKWLEKIGFEIGQEVLIKEQQNKITITTIKIEKKKN